MLRRTIPAFDPDGLLGLKEMEILSDLFGSDTGSTTDQTERPIPEIDPH